jgi:hypothetical protein
MQKSEYILQLFSLIAAKALQIFCKQHTSLAAISSNVYKIRKKIHAKIYKIVPMVDATALVSRIL